MSDYSKKLKKHYEMQVATLNVKVRGFSHPDPGPQTQ
jgi:hypothetical protein